MTNDGNTMERLRADLLRRAQAEREADLEQSIFRDLEAQNQPQVAEEPRRSGFGAFTGRLFGRRNQPEPASSPSIPLEQTDDHVRDVPEVRLEDGDELGTPKSPIPNTRRASNMRFTLPRISRIWTSGANGPGSPAGSEWPAPMNAREAQYDEQQHYQNHPALDDTLQPPEPVSHARSTFRPPSSRYTDIFMMGSREARSARNRDERQRKRRHKKRRPHHVHNEHRRQGSDGRRRLKKTNRKFLFCFPWVQSRAMRSNILRCFVSGLFLVILLSVYLGLSATGNVAMSDFTIVLILVVILATLFFAYGLVRLCMLVVRGDRKRNGRTHLAPDTIMGQYAVPNEPIRVTLARDEEAAGMDAQATKLTPPAYGIWRESVRVDPDRLFWQRSQEAGLENVEERPETRASHRPPSYISDDGVSYVVEAAPRSIAPSSDAPLPPHPSEAGRVVWR